MAVVGPCAGIQYVFRQLVTGLKKNLAADLYSPAPVTPPPLRWTSPPPGRGPRHRMPGSSIGRLIAVTSCKGGVGKSTVSLELARRLAARGHRVGLFDADVHGPSLPAQLPQSVSEQRVQTDASGYAVLPLQHGGLRLMSFGWFSRLWNVHEDDEIRIGRSMLCIQLLHTTEWGELDYLVIDSPPGTGEVPAALATRVPLTGALVVTTPSKLATADVVRGLRMLRRHAVPVLARTVLSNSVAAAHPHAASQGSGRLPSVAGARREHGELRVRWLRQRASSVRARPHRCTPGRAASRAAVLQPADRRRRGRGRLRHGRRRRQYPRQRHGWRKHCSWRSLRKRL